jgi:alkylation response protein AidB-like acyl-CoA dehydrogenase
MVELRPEQQSLVDSVAALARQRFAARAARYDETASFPAEDFEDLVSAGLHAPAVPKDCGGLGLGPYRGDVMTLWLMTREIAKADLSMARCWEGHVNSQVLLDGMATTEQKSRWFPGIVERGEKWVAWSGEPQSRTPGTSDAIGTSIHKVDGGYLIEGTKVFSTSAGHARWAILLVNTLGPGGARHSEGSGDGVILLACDLSDSSVEFDASWWDPIGMRATVSHQARFKQTFIPEENLIGQPGQYLKEGWQACFVPHYAASFHGAAEGAHEFALEYLTAQGKTGDPFVQQHVGQMTINMETSLLWLRYVARLWETGRFEEAKAAGSHARYLIEQLSEDTVKRCIRACGARCLNRPSPVERIYRDLSFYVRHDNADHILATIGRMRLGLHGDISFFKP